MEEVRSALSLRDRRDNVPRDGHSILGGEGGGGDHGVGLMVTRSRPSRGVPRRSVAISGHGEAHTVGVIADTHGLLRPEAAVALASSELIIHAGDVGSAEVLDKLREIASVVAVRGNIDKGPWAVTLPATEIVEIGGVFLCILHDLRELDLDPAAAKFHGVIAGHSHRPRVEHRNGVMFLNPGSAGPRRTVFRHARWRCQACGRWGALEVHHVVKRAGGSDFDLDRLMALRPPCHAQTDAPYAR